MIDSTDLFPFGEAIKVCVGKNALVLSSFGSFHCHDFCVILTLQWCLTIWLCLIKVHFILHMNDKAELIRYTIKNWIFSIGWPDVLVFWGQSQFLVFCPRLELFQFYSSSKQTTDTMQKSLTNIASQLSEQACSDYFHQQIQLQTTDYLFMHCYFSQKELNLVESRPLLS